MAAVKGPPAKGPTLLVAQTDAFKAFLRSSKIKESLTKVGASSETLNDCIVAAGALGHLCLHAGHLGTQVLLDLYEHGPPQAADALG
jgi:hypothetical protein